MKHSVRFDSLPLGAHFRLDGYDDLFKVVIRAKVRVGKAMGHGYRSHPVCLLRKGGIASMPPEEPVQPI